ncbi:hypothetical protein [Allorhodopirellula solitaria]|uniref:hypothetical protein n=1 Tax=Allorhodopirellula solitaria TaxID=2527987 RepID=UPI0011B70F61|nr:hypothetical protein [Allorhodopirellula solitaria]
MTSQGYRLLHSGEESTGTRATPSVVVILDRGQAIGLHLPRFWQKFPKALFYRPVDGPHALSSSGNPVSAVNSVSASKQSTEVLRSRTDAEWEFGLEMFPNQLDVLEELQPGEQSTFEFWLATGAVDVLKEQLSVIADGVRPRNDRPLFCERGRIAWLTPRGADVSPEYSKYLELVDQAVAGSNSFFNKREEFDEYGWRNFGDVFADHESAYNADGEVYVSHYNNQYDMIYGLGIQYLTGGDSKYLELMQDLARHVIDIDIYHTDEDLPCYNHGLFWHTVHYVDAGLSTHRGYPRGTCGGGPSSGHAYARGLLLHYCLTGDPTAYEAVEKMGEWMIAAEDGRYTRYWWLAGGETGLTSASGLEDYHGPGRGPGNAIEVLLSAYELTQQRRFLDQCEVLIRRCVHPDQAPESLDLLDVENKWFYLIFLQALGRYLEVKISMDEIDLMYAYGQSTLLRYADWMVEHERPFLSEPEKLEYPNETWAAQDIRKTEVFQWAARHTTGDQRARYLERAQWFFRHAVEELDGFETKGLCRPIALLLANGYTYEYFRRGGLDELPPAPTAPAVTFPPQVVFRSQKTRAIANLKRTLMLGLLVCCGGVLAGAWWWIRT